MPIVVRAALLLLAVFLVVSGGQLLLPVALVGGVVGSALLSAARARPERAALALAVLAVAGGGLAAGARAVDAALEERVDYRGSLSVEEILDGYASPAGGGAEKMAERERGSHGYLAAADGEMAVPDAGAGLVALWSLAELAPWLLAALALALLAPLVRAAERGDPFRHDAGARLSLVGSVLLIGIPAIVVLEYLVAYVADGTGASISPIATPEVTLSATHLLPGALVLVLARVFRHGAELRELERHTV
jgi:hypothetical protein